MNASSQARKCYLQRWKWKDCFWSPGLSAAGRSQVFQSDFIETEKIIGFGGAFFIYPIQVICSFMRWTELVEYTEEGVFTELAEELLTSWSRWESCLVPQFGLWNFDSKQVLFLPWIKAAFPNVKMQEINCVLPGVDLRVICIS